MRTIFIFLTLCSLISFDIAAESIREYLKEHKIRMYKKNTVVKFDTVLHVFDDEYFFSAFDEIHAMLNGEKECDFKRAEFLVEWAYASGNMDYDVFCNSIDDVVAILKREIMKRNISRYKTAANAVLFEYFTQPNMMNGYKPFIYDVEDCGGEQDYTKLMVSKVMRTHSGQYTSLPFYYKILCNELKGESFIAAAPSHCFVKHKDENGKWVNVELTSWSFARDEWYMQLYDIPIEGIKSGTYLSAFSPKEEIALLLYNLGVAYARLHGDYDCFNLICGNTILKYIPDNLYGWIMLREIYQQWGYDYIHKYGKAYSHFFYCVVNWHEEIEYRLDKLGYKEMSKENYLRCIEEAKEFLKNKSIGR